MEGEKLMPDSVEAKLDAIRTYLQEHLYKAYPDLRRYPKKGSIELLLVPAHGAARTRKGSIELLLVSAPGAARTRCELCGLDFVSGGPVLLVEYDTEAGARTVVPVCVNLKACQDRRNAKTKSALSEQQTIAETVILP